MKKIATTLLLAGSLFLGASCSDDVTHNQPATPTITPGPATLGPERLSETKKRDVATAMVPAEASATP